MCVRPITKLIVTIISDLIGLRSDVAGTVYTYVPTLKRTPVFHDIPADVLSGVTPSARSILSQASLYILKAYCGAPMRKSTSRGQSIIDRTRAFGPGTIGAGGVPDFLVVKRLGETGARKRKERKKKKRKRIACCFRR